MTNETIADIVREIRKDDGVRMDFPGMVKAVPNIWILKWCDRIEAAAKATIYTDNSETLRNALAENDRLRAALLTICTADKPAEGLREIAIDAMNNRVAKAVKESEAKYEHRL